MTSAQVFDGIAALAQLGSAIVLAFGVVVGWKQLRTWREEASIKKRAEVAERLLLAAYRIDDVLRSLRSPFDSIPKEKLGDKTYLYEKRWNRFLEFADEFSELRAAQLHADLLFEDPAIVKAVDDLFKVRSSTMTAIEMLSGDRDLASESREDKETYNCARRDMYGSYSKRDELGQTQIKAVSVLRDRLAHFVRMEI